MITKPTLAISAEYIVLVIYEWKICTNNHYGASLDDQQTIQGFYIKYIAQGIQNMNITDG
jgi:hypothetical protein